MELIEKLERSGRLVLWLVISAVLVIGFAVVPLKVVKQNQEAVELRSAIEELESDLRETREAQKKPEIDRIAIDSLGPMFRALSYNEALGRIWFTNVSPRRGAVCIQGTAKNEETGASSISMPGCAIAEPYSTSKIELTFASGDLSAACPGGTTSCALSLEDVPDAPSEAPE